MVLGATSEPVWLQVAATAHTVHPCIPCSVVFGLLSSAASLAWCRTCEVELLLCKMDFVWT
jgi:hypothetical protein